MSKFALTLRRSAKFNLILLSNLTEAAARSENRSGSPVNDGVTRAISNSIAFFEY